MLNCSLRDRHRQSSPRRPRNHPDAASSRKHLPRRLPSSCRFSGRRPYHRLREDLIVSGWPPADLPPSTNKCHHKVTGAIPGRANGTGRIAWTAERRGAAPNRPNDGVPDSALGLASDAEIIRNGGHTRDAAQAGRARAATADLCRSNGTGCHDGGTLPADVSPRTRRVPGAAAADQGSCPPGRASEPSAQPANQLGEVILALPVHAGRQIRIKKWGHARD